jgi:hypothetical protein
MAELITLGQGVADGAGLGRAQATVGPSGLVIVAPGPRSRTVPLPAVLFGVPWFAGVITLGVWYLGWGEVPESFWVRALLWVVAIALTHNLGTLAYLTIWNAFYERIGTETLTIDPEYIVVVRKAGRFKREHRIRRKIIEVAEVLPPGTRRPGRPRIEIKSWRAAIGFGAGLDPQEAEACARVIQALFDGDAAVRHAAEVAGGVEHETAPVAHSAEDGEPAVPGSTRTSIMREYREALESRGSVRRRLGAIASVARSRSRRK